ncbi:MAG: DEAD/DEAH box helicase, partial [Myxococcota bacterium]|nr:DEAD/DEAH box helicase [Myxococcota bacterium]
IEEVMADLGSERPMDRLVCGDVGFGKTEVAMRAAFRAVMAGKQAAVLVPTTVLAQQHYQSFCQRFSPYPINVEVLSRFRTDAQNRETIFKLKTGLVDIVIGTHRLLSKDVHFKQLGLLVIDEEHRFGVAHKERVRALRTTVDTLTLTATPIPRTLQMAMGGVRDLSLIATPPMARKPVRTLLCHDEPKTLATAIERELSREGQVFYVHNRVKDIGKAAERVRQLAPKARVVVGHGQMKEDELERVMFDFVSGRYDILVCTTIIESGLDIPRANTIIIDRADTFGMAQLYQLRGRVGRSHQQAYAYLVVPPQAQLADDARTRVETLVRHTELGAGFAVATMDLELRGSGDILGAQQSGNVAAVGLEMFCDLLAAAVAELRGEPREEEIEPELTFETPGLIPQEYVPDVGERLQWYKRLASASSETHVQHIAGQIIDRCGPLPRETDELIKAMVAKALCRRLGIRGLEVTSRGIVVHLAPDCLVKPTSVLELIRRSPGRIALTQDMKIRLRLARDEQDCAQAAIHFLHELASYDTNSSES